ncbi:MAG: serine hydrolase [Patescibacteria group bacterium]
MRRERLARQGFFRFLRLFLLVIFIAVIFAVVISWPTKKTLVSPIASSLADSNLPSQDTKEGSGLADVVQNELEDVKGQYAVVISNLKTGEGYSFNEHKSFDAGSLYKLWVMGEVFEQIREGKLSEDQVLSEEISLLNEKFKISSESAELTEGKIELPVYIALQRMITISDNYSALLLAWKLRLSKVTAYLTGHGLLESNVGGVDDFPTTTAYDAALFFEKLYKGELSDANSNSKMLELLKKQQLNKKLPKYLPSGTIIAHKTGELGLISHDAGIVYSPKGDYIIVIMTDTPRPADAEEKIARISKKVFDYFQK